MKQPIEVIYVADTSFKNASLLIEGDLLLFTPSKGEREIVTFKEDRGYGLGVIDSNGQSAIVSGSRVCKLIPITQYDIAALPTKGILLSEEELKKIMADAFAAGELYEYEKHFGAVPPLTENKEQYIESQLTQHQ